MVLWCILLWRLALVFSWVSRVRLYVMFAFEREKKGGKGREAGASTVKISGTRASLLSITTLSFSSCHQVHRLGTLNEQSNGRPRNATSHNHIISNNLRQHRRRAVLCDFGIARVLPAACCWIGMGRETGTWARAFMLDMFAGRIWFRGREAIDR